MSAVGARTRACSRGWPRDDLLTRPHLTDLTRMTTAGEDGVVKRGTKGRHINYVRSLELRSSWTGRGDLEDWDGKMGGICRQLVGQTSL